MPTQISGSTGIDKVQDGSINQIDLAADIQQVGVGQTWQNMTGSRVLGTVYTNSTGKPISVLVSWNSTGGIATASISGLTVFTSPTSGTYMATTFLIVPSGATYSFSGGNGILTWAELR